MKLIIISGLSGAGKTVALHTLEDMGVFTVDNLPVPLLSSFAQLLTTGGKHSEAAVAIDVRNASFFQSWPAVRQELLDSGHRVETLFLEASEECLITRFSTTRRPHPLRGGALSATILDERRQLATMRKHADCIIDTTNYTVHELRANLISYFNTFKKPPIIASIFSFGFKRGVPHNADLIFDVRFLPNPYFVEELSKLPGFDPLVTAFLESYPETKEFIDKIEDLLNYLLPKYRDEGKSYISCGIGCTGGQHRSVYVAQTLAGLLNAKGHGIQISHRDVVLPEGYIHPATQGDESGKSL
ncbi:RNase adapter RapZ [Myxococcota bacterium]|nr:RNase adapter RapZ [Myxococcota bacterium]MBU1534562.1 RNase adapter RapZ [Myxococcota bacterium]